MHGLGRSPGEGSGSPLQSSCLEIPVDSGTWRTTVYGVTGVRHDWATKRTAHYKSPENVSFLLTLLPWDQLMSFLWSSFYWNWYFQASVGLHLVNQIVSSHYTSYVIFSCIRLITNFFLKYYLHLASCFGCERTFVFIFVLFFPDHDRIHLISLLWWFSVPDPNTEKTSLLNIWFPEWQSPGLDCLLSPLFEFPGVTCNSSLFRLTLICPQTLDTSYPSFHFWVTTPFLQISILSPYILESVQWNKLEKDKCCMLSHIYIELKKKS